MRSIKRVRYILCFLLLFALCWLFPYSGDDWWWGSSAGLENLANHFEGYNGRYFGNLVVLALTRSNLLKSAVMSLCLTGILWLIPRMTNQCWAFYLIALLLLFIPREIAQQAIYWTSGFSNYVVSTVLTMAYVSQIYWVFDDPDEVDSVKLGQSWLQGLVFFVIGLFGAMIMEYMTLLNLAIGAFVLVFVFYRFRKVLVQHVCYFAGTLVGAILMFSNSAYAAAFSGAGGQYQYVPHALKEYVGQAFVNYFQMIYRQFYWNNLALNLAILIAMVLLYLYLFRTLALASKHQSRAALACLVVSASYWVYSALSQLVIGNEVQVSSLCLAEGIFTLAAGVSLIVFSLIAAKLTHKTEKILFLICCILVMVMPLFFIAPIGPRCFFATYVFFLLFLVELLSMLLPDRIDPLLRKTVKRVARAGIAAALLFYFAVFSQIYSVNNGRIAHVRQEVSEGKTVDEIQRLPNRHLLWNSTPYEDSIWSESFKDFYDLPTDITLIPVEQYGESEINK